VDTGVCALPLDGVGPATPPLLGVAGALDGPQERVRKRISIKPVVLRVLQLTSLTPCTVRGWTASNGGAKEECRVQPFSVGATSIKEGTAHELVPWCRAYPATGALSSDLCALGAAG